MTHALVSLSHDAGFGQWRCSCNVVGSGYRFRNEADVAMEWVGHRDAKNLTLDEEYLARQLAFSLETFGPGTRLLGVLDHIRKELVEVQAEPLDVEEWADLLILAFDGVLRQGFTPAQVIQAVRAKHRKNELRKWPDWRTADCDKAIEHVRTCPDCDKFHDETFACPGRAVVCSNLGLS